MMTTFDGTTIPQARGSPSWAYQERADGRDLRIDFLRGMAIAAVVVDHLAFWRPTSYSLLHLVTVERIGAVSAAEFFVLLAGFVLGMVHCRRIARDGWTSSAERLLSRALVLYRVGVVAGMVFWLLGFIPGLTSALFPSSSVDGLHVTLADLLLLRGTPPHLIILGLYVALLALAPALLWLLVRHRTSLLLAASWALWLVAAAYPTRVLPTPSWPEFPLLTWQLLFVNGLVMGYHRETLLRVVQGWRGRLILAVACVIVVSGLAVTADNTYWEGVVGWGRGGVLARETYQHLWDGLFVRATLGLGRVADVGALLIIAYVALTRWWGILGRGIGWFFIPLGQASLYVYLVHAAIALPLEQVGMVHAGRYRLATLVHLAVLALIWLLVRYRVLFRWIPR